MPVEALSPSDLPAILAIEQACYPDPWTEEMLSSAWTVPHCRGVKVVAGGQLAAYLIFSILPSEIEILNIAVAPTYRRKGIARTLLQWLLTHNHGRRIENFFLEVRASNLAALQLYKSFGFVHVHTRRHYYRDGEDALVMSAMI